MDNLVERLAVGSQVCIQTVTHYYVGIVESVDGESCTLKQVSWIADTGRSTNFYADVAKASEVEVFPVDALVTIYKNAMVVSYPIPGALPVKQK